MQRLDKIVKSIPDCRDHIKISEAYALFGISKYTVYRLIRKGAISHVNLETNQIRVSKQEQQQKKVMDISEAKKISIVDYLEKKDIPISKSEEGNIGTDHHCEKRKRHHL